MIDKNKKLHRRESNPGRKRERLECYQLHHNGLLNIRKAYVQQDEHIGLACLGKKIKAKIVMVIVMVMVVVIAVWVSSSGSDIW